MNISEQFFKDHDLYCWKDNSKLLSNTISFDKINNSFKKYKNHPSIACIKTLISKFWHFSFRIVSLDEVKTFIQDFKNNKSTGSEMPVGIRKGSKFTFEILKKCINRSNKDGSFPDS